MNKMILVAAAVLVIVAGGVVLLVPTDEKKSTARMGEELLPFSEQVKVSYVEVAQAGKDTIKMQKDDTGLWKMERDEFPVDPKRLETLFRELSEAKIRSAMPQTSDDAVEYGVDGLTYVALGKSADDLNHTIEIGKDRPGGGVFVKPAKGEQVFLVGRSIAVNADPAHWERKTLTQVDKKLIKKVTVSDPRGKEVVSFSRQKAEEEFAILGVNTDETNQYELKNLAGLPENLSFKERLPADDEVAAKAMEKPYTVEFVTFDDATIQLAVGASGKEKEQRVFVTVSVDGDVKGARAEDLKELFAKWQFEVPQFLLDRVTKKKADYLAKKS